MSNNKKHLKEEAIRLRVEEGLSLKKIAEKLGISVTTASVWLRSFPLSDEEIKERQRKYWETEAGKTHLQQIGELAKVARKQSLENLTHSMSIRKRILDERGHKCEICGWQAKNEFFGRVPVQIHHINGNRKDNRRENLIVLCPNCHSLTENFMNFKNRIDP